MVNLETVLCGTTISNPIIPASGVFGYGKEFSELYDINMLGTFSFKGTTLNERYGNPTPRIAEAPSGMLNSVGLQNPGVDKVINTELPQMKSFFHKKVMANISGFSVDEYVKVCEKFNVCDEIGWYEINISCPNVHGGGMSFGVTPEGAYEVTKAVKAVSKKPCIIKLSPNVTDMTQIAAACESAGADGLSLINTLMGMRIDIKRRRPVLANITGGLSGSAVFPVALRCVWQVYETVKIPVIGMGGISSAEDVVEMLLAGASAVEIGAANLINPFVCRDIINELPTLLEKIGVKSIKELIGGAHNG